MMKDDFLWGLTTQEFQKMLINALEQVIEPLKPAKESRSIELLTREETAKFLRISLPTLAKWSKQGIIHAISMGGRIYYSLSEIQNILEKKGGKHV
ncbi:MAG: excisionase [Parabacteroides sp. merdae-related_45_40]|uniref:DNA-binding protein n=2 Tax=Parabacteroides merdae TaxID=46503 RepID=A0A414BS94_9BACT|nr:MAG: excisionase [Parabacteroides sp. merdae-related_45_40]RHC79259.1 DNA-binding protein [Parabacteroides merdae]